MNFWSKKGKKWLILRATISFYWNQFMYFGWNDTGARKIAPEKCDIIYIIYCQFL